MPIRLSSSVVNFSLKWLISQKWPDNFFSFLVWSFLKNMDLLNHPEGHFLLGKLFDNFFSIYARSFPRRVLMNSKNMDSIESL